MFDCLIPPCFCFLLTSRWFICVFPWSCVPVVPHLLSFKLVDFCFVAWVSTAFDLMDFFAFCVLGISLHVSWLLISICLLPCLCLGPRLCNCNTQDILLISTFYRVQVRSFLALVGGFTLGINANNVFLPVLNGHTQCQGKEPTITEKNVRSCCVKNNKWELWIDTFSPWQVLGISVACQRPDKN